MPTIADRFLSTFGARAFSLGEARALAALQWLSDNDPNGTGELVGQGADQAIHYTFTDHSTLLLDLTSNTFLKAN